MKKYAIIVAAGSGTRMGISTPKQFLLLHGQPLIWYSIEAFFEAYADIEIILVLADDYVKTGKEIIASTRSPHLIKITTGGETRFSSVRNGLQHVPDNAIVFVHDGVRCLLSADLIQRCYEIAFEKGNAIPATTATDSIRIETPQENRIADRNTVRIIQTPQTFHSSLLKAAFEQPYNESFTDEASVAEQLGVKIILVEGEPTNIKITRKTDLLIAEQVLAERGIFSRKGAK